MSQLKVLIWTHHPGDLLGDAIDFLTHGTAQHAGWLDIDGSVVEAYWPKLRRRYLIAEELPFIKSFSIRGITLQQQIDVSKMLALNLTHPPEYSGWDLFGFLFNKPNTNENSTFCSRYVQHTCEMVLPQENWPLIRCVADDWVSPRDLYISNMLIPVALYDDLGAVAATEKPGAQGAGTSSTATAPEIEP